MWEFLRSRRSRGVVVEGDFCEASARWPISHPTSWCQLFSLSADGNIKHGEKHPANFYDGNSYVGCIRTVFVHKLNRHTF